jgi:hypothetical protein
MALDLRRFFPLREQDEIEKRFVFCCLWESMHFGIRARRRGRFLDGLRAFLMQGTREAASVHQVCVQ